jgi:Mn-dependent DtxR family transcriptional regulator
VTRPKRPPPGQRAVLSAVRQLGANGQQASAVAVAEKLGISRQVATRQLEALERKGLLADVPKVVRSGHWALTELGKEL